VDQNLDLGLGAINDGFDRPTLLDERTAPEVAGHGREVRVAEEWKELVQIKIVRGSSAMSGVESRQDADAAIYRQFPVLREVRVAAGAEAAYFGAEWDGEVVADGRFRALG